MPPLMLITDTTDTEDTMVDTVDTTDTPIEVIMADTGKDPLTEPTAAAAAEPEADAA